MAFYRNRIYWDPDFWNKKIFRRDQVKSVFIRENQIIRDGIVTSRGYSVALRIPDLMRLNGSYPIILIEIDDVAGQNENRIDFNNVLGADSEALVIAQHIADHWNIPLSV